MSNRGDYAASKGTRPVPLAVDPTQQALIHLQVPTRGSSALLNIQSLPVLLYREWSIARRNLCHWSFALPWLLLLFFLAFSGLATRLQMHFPTGNKLCFGFTELKILSCSSILLGLFCYSGHTSIKHLSFHLKCWQEDWPTRRFPVGCQR